MCEADSPHLMKQNQENTGYRKVIDMEYAAFGSKIKYIYYSGSNKKKLAEFAF